MLTMHRGSSNGTIIIIVACFLSVHFVYCNEDVLQFQYHNYSSMTSFLKQYSHNNSGIAQLYSIGQSVQKRELWVMKITRVGKDTPLIPNIKLLANIHGNEAAGREILLHFIPYVVNSYKQGDEKITHILNNNVLHVLPSLNPDGFEKSREGRCSGIGRENSRDVDLNRSFPDFFRMNPIHRQPETEAVIKWMNQTKFILSASLHGGAMVANYPFESTKEDLFIEEPENKSPDDDVFQSLALLYSKVHPTMHFGRPCHGSIEQRTFKDGITNGAAWYSLIGGMQDYNYAFHGCMELTLEVSCCKYPPAADLYTIWMQNKEALTDYCLQAGMGVKGVVHDVNSMEPINGASLMIDGRNMTFYTSRKGEFYRILLPGNYKLKVTASNYTSATIPFSVQQQGSIKTMTVLVVKLNPGNSSDNIAEELPSPTTVSMEFNSTEMSITPNTLIGIKSNIDDDKIFNITEDTSVNNGSTQYCLDIWIVYWNLIIHIFICTTAHRHGIPLY